MMADACTTLRYRSPAAEWTDALPLGNGRLGAMCFGGVGLDRFQLNENTCWSGSPATAAGSRRVTDGPGLVAAAREALARDDVRAAEESLRGLQGGNSQAFQPLADLWIAQPPDTEPTVYQRHLDMRTAVVSHTYSGPAGRVSQEAWIGPDALIVRRRMANPSPLRLRLTSPHPTATVDLSPASGGGQPAGAVGHDFPAPGGGLPAGAVGRDSPAPGGGLLAGAMGRDSLASGGGQPAGAVGHDLVMTVRMPSNVPPVPAPVEYGPEAVTALVGLRVLGGGQVQHIGDELVVDGGDEIVLIVAAVTDYVDPLSPPHGKDLSRTLRARLDAVATALAREGGYTALRAAHEREHRRLFSRAGLRLGSQEARLDTADRLRAHAAGESDPALAALQFQYGRYLLISSSRPGGLPAGLQGLWNEHVRPPWNANYTTNINLEMNYWPALVTGLPECHQPLLDWLRHAEIRGHEVARELYGLPGWTMHHNSDAWCFALPAGVGHDEPCWSFWPLAAVWLTRHAAEHHACTGDDSYLPLLRGAAEFALAWLTELGDGTLGTSPSTSPENEYIAPDGKPAAVSTSTTADLALIRDLLTHVTGDTAARAENVTGDIAARTENITGDIAARAEKALLRIPAERTTADGHLAEWVTDVIDAEPGHRHTSHLFGVFPGATITPDRTPGLAAAARRSLDARGLESTGWSLAWRIALRARLRDPAGAYAAVHRFLQAAEDSAGVYRNLFCAHPPFQIDGNFGFTAGVAEMLLQSHDSEIHLLPALPAEWAEGAFAGLRARGRVTVDMTWSLGAPTDVQLRSDTDRTATVRFGDHRTRIDLRAGVTTALPTSW
ncbi:glycosyl hydrolase family 95 catalytic domain-containing protein [Paractinoplanes bogorensis]|nr:glycoside hydrolase N-terminal domain-containing protein [Actinoplanes bogorensis]